jgi:hypothetical protein
MQVLTVRGLFPGTAIPLSLARGVWPLPKSERGLEVARVAQSSGRTVEENFMPAVWMD